MYRKSIQLCRAGMFQLYIPKVNSSYLDFVIHYFRHAFQPMYLLRSRLTTSAINKDVDACLLRLGTYVAKQNHATNLTLPAWQGHVQPCSPFSIGFLFASSFSMANLKYP